MAVLRWVPLIAMFALPGCTSVRVVPPQVATEGGLTPSVVEATIADLQTALDTGRLTSREIVRQYLARIAVYEDILNAAIAVNPRALEDADALDRERRAGRVRGPLHGIPIALKDNIHAHGMRTTGGALAFAELTPPYEATLTRNLRESGAIILAKTSMTELANWVAGFPTPMPGGYNALTGFALNPYDPRRDPRELADGPPALSTGGSSSGVGTAASFWAANVGTETSGSILTPASQTMLAAIKPTVGRISRHGVIPVTADQDTPGPMAKTVTDVALLLGALEGASPDPNDAATRTCSSPRGRDYTQFLRIDGLKRARIGIPRAFYYNPLNLPGLRGGGLGPAQTAVMTEAIRVLAAQGAVIVDPVDIPSVIDRTPGKNVLFWLPCSGADDRRGRDEGCSIVLKYGMKRDFNAWLTSLGPAARVKTLTALREWNIAHRKVGALKYGQAALDISDEIQLDADRARYEADRAKDVALGGASGIDAAIRAHQLDAVLFPGASGAHLAAMPGYPTVMVPFGRVPNTPMPPFPPAFNAAPGPYGVSFTGTACSEPRLLELAYAFEQATKRRVPPPLFP